MYEYMNDLLEKFLVEQKVRNLSENTIITYKQAILEFISYCDELELDLKDVEVADVRSYMGKCVDKQRNQTVTLRKKINAIRQFMQWAVLNELLEYNSAEDIQLKRPGQKLPGLLDIETVNLILDQPAPIKNEEEKLLWVRDKAMLEMLYSSGLRVSELQGLRIKDIDINRLLVRVTGKGNKTRVIPIGTKAREAVLALLQVYSQFKSELSPDAYLYLSRYGRQLSVRQIRYRVLYQAERAGISNRLYPHLLRHCFATHMLSSSGDLRAVQEMLGHARANTTQIYTHLDYNHLASIYDKAHPRAHLKK